MIECHSPKPILLATGQVKIIKFHCDFSKLESFFKIKFYSLFLQLNFPYQWQPHVVPTQLFKIGNLFLAGVPGEV